MSIRDKKGFIQKHKPLTKADVKRRFTEMEKAKTDMTKDASVLEQNLMDFNKTLDPMVDPAKGTVLCWIRRPTAKEYEEMLPAELLEYRGDPDEVPQEVLKKYQDFQFDMMARLIENPKHDTKWWKSHANLVFQTLFQMHITNIMEELGISVGNF